MFLHVWYKLHRRYTLWSNSSNVQTGCPALSPLECKYITFKKQLIGFSSGFFCDDPWATRRPKLSQGRCRKTSWFNKDFLESKKKKNHKHFKHFGWPALTFTFLPCTCMKLWQLSTNGPCVICLKAWHTSGRDGACWTRASWWWISVRATRKRIFDPS